MSSLEAVHLGNVGWKMPDEEWEWVQLTSLSV